MRVVPCTVARLRLKHNLFGILCLVEEPLWTAESLEETVEGGEGSVVEVAAVVGLPRCMVAAITLDVREQEQQDLGGIAGAPERLTAALTGRRAALAILGILGI